MAKYLHQKKTPKPTENTAAKLPTSTAAAPAKPAVPMTQAEKDYRAKQAEDLKLFFRCRFHNGRVSGNVGISVHAHQNEASLICLWFLEMDLLWEASKG
jgi:hypothetical protein